MRRTTPLSLLALLSIPLSAPAQAPDGNAAVDYWRGAYMLNRGNMQTIRDLDWETIGNEMDPQKLPQQFKDAAVLVPEDAIGSLMRGARTARCDFQVQFRRGPI